MFAKLDQVEKRFESLSEKLSDPKVISKQDEFQKISREYSELREIVEAYREYKKLREEIEGGEELARGSDREMAELAREEVYELKEKIAQTESRLKLLLLPKDPNDGKNVFLEIRAGTGGEEAALFAADLYRLYLRFAEKMRWRSEVMNVNETGLGGLKEVIVLLEGKDVYSQLKFEAGVHRVQRIPETEGGGRIHTSAVTVVVLPEAEDIDVKIDDKDLQIDVMRAGGPGGQSVNTTDSAVRITHIPSGIVVICQDEKSQHKNKAKAMRVLRSRILEMEIAKQNAEISSQRKLMVGSGDRSERIRTYNFPQNRVTDHRIGLTLHKLDSVMEGDLDEIITALRTSHQAELLQASKNEGDVNPKAKKGKPS